MKRSLVAISLLMFVLGMGTSCRETKEKTVVIEKEAEVEENKGILEKAGEKADKEVNEEIDKVIEDIGDDN